MLRRFIRFVRGFYRIGYIGTIAAVVGIASSLYSASKAGKGGGSTAPPYYSPGGLIGADTAWQNLLSSLQADVSQVTGAVNPMLSASYALMLGVSPDEMVSAANRAGTQYGDLANESLIRSRTLEREGQGMFEAGRGVYDLARDPQNELYGRTRQRVVEGSRAAQSARGITMSPYGAGLEAEAGKNFDIDWENNLLNRSIAGLNAMGRAGEVGRGQITGAQELERVAPQFTMASGAVPFEARRAAARVPGEAAAQYSDWFNAAILQPQAAIQSQIIPYLNFGQGSGANAFNAAAANRQFGADQTRQSFSGLIQGMNELGRIYNNPNSGFYQTFNQPNQMQQEWAPFQGAGYYGAMEG